MNCPNKIDSDLTSVSKFLSFILRHKPDAIDLKLDPEGWAFLSELIEKAKCKITLTREQIEQIVAACDKQRFKISSDGLKIRASQGHSIKIDLRLESIIPPSVLYHGTATRFMGSILQEGLKPKDRHHVHLSKDISTAENVGKRYGKPIILEIDARAMHQQGHEFFMSENKVWLTTHVPVQFLRPLN